MTAAAGSVELACPAKINLSLNILGRREDGFHKLHSVVAQVAFGDSMSLSWNPDESNGMDSVKFGPGDSLEVPEDNTVTRAIQLFRSASGINHGGFRVQVEKHIPQGAGLGGGSSDGVAALRAIRQVMGSDCPDIDWVSLAASIGSDCPLFLEQRPIIMEGRGEIIQPLTADLATRFEGQSVFIFKPVFSINTAEAYKRLAAKGFYSDPEQIEHQMQAWRQGTEILPPMGNDFERLCAVWIPGLALVLERLRNVHGLDARMSGSGSACFVIGEKAIEQQAAIEAELERAWGNSYWRTVSRLK